MHRYTIVALFVMLWLGPAMADDASLTFIFTNNGEPLEDPTHAKFYLYEPEKRDEYITWGHAAKPAEFPEGRYDLVIRFRYGEIVEEHVRLEMLLTGKTIELFDFNIPIAELTVDITSGNNPISPFAGSFSVYPAGERGRMLARKRPGETLIIRPGTYDVAISYRDSEGLQSTWLEDYYLVDTRYETIEIGLPLSELTLTLTEDGEPIPVERGTWRVYIPGDRGTFLAERGSGETLALEAGEYDIGAVYESEHGSLERWVVKLAVDGELSELIEMGRPKGSLQLDITQRGTPLPDAWFTVYPYRDRRTPILSAHSGSEVMLEPGIYDIGCFLRDDGLRAEQWIEATEIRSDVRLTVELDARAAYLRVDPSKRRGRNGKSSGRLLLLLDSSSAMRARMEGQRRIDLVRSVMREVLADRPGDADDIGLRVFGASSENDPDCRDSALVASPDAYDLDDVYRALDGLVPDGNASLAHALQEVADDLRPREGNTLVVVTSSVDGCGGDPCRAAAKLIRGGHVERVFVIGLGVGLTQRPELDCIGRFYSANSRAELKAALGEVIHRGSRQDHGSLAVFETSNPQYWVAGGSLGEKIELTEGTYDIVIRSAGRTYTWDGVRIDGNFEARAGRKPKPR
jgi:hypothetical protein